MSFLAFQLRLCVLGLLIFQAGVCAAQPASSGLVVTNSSQFTFRTWTTKQGLPENTVNMLLQTRDGYLWVGTPDGLACFDGVQFRRYGLRDGLPHVGITSLLEDRRGVLWVGTENGLTCCEGGRNPAPNFKLELPGVFVYGLAEDAEGRLWVGTDKGLYESSNGHLHLAGQDTGFPQQHISILYTDRSGGVWVWGDTSTLYRIWQGKATEIQADFPFPRARTVHCILEDHLGRIWISTGNGFMICRENGAWKKITESRGVPYDYVSSMVETKDGTLWAGSYGGGLFRLMEDRFVPLQRIPGAASDATKFIFTLQADLEGNLWAGSSSGGLICVQNKKLTTLAADAGLSNDVVQSVTELPGGQLMAATEGGLYRQDRGRFQKFLTHTKADIYMVARSVLATSDSNVWWAADRNLFSLNTTRQTMFTNLDINPQTKSNTTVSCLFEDRQHALWMGASTGLWRQRGGDFELVAAVPPAYRVVALAESAKNTFAAGTTRSGLFLISAQYTNHYTVADGLGSDAIRALYYDRAGVLWIGTRSGGLSQLKDGVIFTCTTQDGLINDTVSQILEDDNGNLWLGSNQGISRIAKQEFDDLATGKTALLHPLNLGTEDGMLSEQCSSGYGPSALKSRSGLLYFCTLKGIVVLDPKRFESHEAPPTVVIEKVLVNSHVMPAAALDLYGQSGSGNQPAQKIVLPPGQNNLEFHYTGLHSAAPESIIFRYKLEGLDKELDKDWTDAGTRRFANYPHVQPGHYRFIVSAANRDGNWPEPQARLNLFLQPYFYQTWWFSAGTVTAAALALTLLVRYLVKRRLRRRLELLELQQSLENERRRIARDLHDELGARLTGITHLGELAMRSSQSPSEMYTQLAALTNRVRQLMGIMDEVVWTINPQNDSLPNIVSFLSDYMERFLAPTNIRWRLDTDPDFPNIIVPAQARHNLLLAAKETLNNAVKHASATMIRMRIQMANGQLEIIVSDDGRGFDLTEVRTGSDGLMNIRKRMELIKGTVEFQSGRDKGTTVKLSAPLPEVAHGK